MVDKRPIGYEAGKTYVNLQIKYLNTILQKFLDKRPPKSTKFEHVQKNVNTGLTIKDV